MFYISMTSVQCLLQNLLCGDEGVHLRQCASCVLIGILIGVDGIGQDAMLPLGSPAYALEERYEILTGSSDELHSAIKPFRRGDIFAMAYQQADTSNSAFTVFDLKYLLADNDEFYFLPGKDLSADNTSLTAQPPLSRTPILGIFYTRPAHLYALDLKDFYLRVNPIVHFGLGKEDNRSGLLFVNRRGVEIRGGIDQKVFFNTNIIEAQLRPASHVKRYVDDFLALPDAGLFKDFDSRIFEGDGAYDYLSSTGYFGFDISRHVGMQLGHGKNFIGDGYRSLFLSDFAKNYFYLKLNTRVWRFHYQNIFAELSAREKLPGNVVVPKKYLAAHYLSFAVTPRFTLGLYEAVVFAREENRFELQYLNPVILYRSIEHHVGSPDNVCIGLSAKWDVAKRVRFYGQFILDEFKVTEFFSDQGWWGNKHGFQLGGKYLNVFGVSSLDLQIEYNRVRPFTYTHYDSLGSYSHFNQPLAHPSGANFSEVLLKVDYRPISRLWLDGRLFMIQSGSDIDSESFGSNILRSNSDRNADFGIEQGQGIPIQNRILSFTAMYMLKHNVFLEAQYFIRNYDSDFDDDDLLTRYGTVGLRWNFFPMRDEF